MLKETYAETVRQNQLKAGRETVSLTIQIPVRKYRALMEMANQKQMESLTFIKEVATDSWWCNSFECPCQCRHDDLRTFCQNHDCTDCFGALMRFLLLED
jgi:hypothetical protein